MPTRPGLSLADKEKILDRAFAVKKAPAVAIIVNSPGGSPAQSSLLYRRLRQLRERHNRPVYVFVEDVAASGGYMIACAGDAIYVDVNSIVGSIGVISAGFGFTELIKRWGIERRVHTSGERKTLLDAFDSEKPEDIERLKAIQKEIHNAFIDLVRERRGDALKNDDGMLFSGEFWCGREAVSRGLADGIGDPDTILREKFGDNIKFRPFESRSGLLTTLRGRTAMPSASAAGLLTAARREIEDTLLWNRYGL